MRARSIRKRRQPLNLGGKQGPPMVPEGFKLSYAVSYVTSPAQEWMPMLPISVGPNTRRLAHLGYFIPYFWIFIKYIQLWKIWV